MALSENDLLEALADSALKDQQRCEFLAELTVVATGESTPLLAWTLKSEMSKARYLAIKALARIGGSEEVDLIVSALDSEDTNMIWFCVESLARKIDRVELRRVLPQLICYMDEHGSKLDATNRSWLVSAIAAARSPSAVGALARYAMDSNWQSRRDAAIGLMWIDNDESRAALQRVVDTLSRRKGHYARSALKKRYGQGVLDGRVR